MRKSVKHFFLFHALLICAVLIFPLYRYIVSILPKGISGCFLHDRLFLYCPVCGGTRAVAAILHFHFYEALCDNAFVVLCLFAVLIWYVRAWIAVIRKKETLPKIPGWLWILFSILLILFGIARNVALIRFHFDPLGDLSFFWNRIN